MRTRASRAAFAATTLAFLLLPLTACSPGSTAAPEQSATQVPPSAEPQISTDTAESSDASAEMFGCTQAVFDYISDKGYPTPEALDPATFEIPSASFTQTPDCYLRDDDGGVPRHSAFWTSDPQGVLASLGSSLDAGGYAQSDEYGPLVWWQGGDDPLTAAHSLSAAPQPIDGVDTLWASWS